MGRKTLCTVVEIISCAVVGAYGVKSVSDAGNEPVKGAVVIYTSMYRNVINIVDKKLERAFPGCNITFFYGGTEVIQAKVKAEVRSGRLGCDMLMVADPAYSYELKKAGMLVPYKSPQAVHLVFPYDPAGFWYPVRVSTMLLAYNPRFCSPKDVPGSMKEFATDRRIRGCCAVTDPAVSGSSLAALGALYDVYGVSYFSELGRQKVAVESGTTALEKLENGEYREIMVLEEAVLARQEEEGAELEVIYPSDGVICIPSTIMTICETWSANSNVAACRAITDWFLSEEGQKCIVCGWMHPVREDIQVVPYDSLPNDTIYGKTIPVDWKKTLQERNRIRDLFSKYTSAGTAP